MKSNLNTYKDLQDIYVFIAVQTFIKTEERDSHIHFQW